MARPDAASTEVISGGDRWHDDVDRLSSIRSTFIVELKNSRQFSAVRAEIRNVAGQLTEQKGLKKVNQKQIEVWYELDG